jgi:hypothetical protein
MEAININNNPEITEQPEANFTQNRGNFRGRGRGGFKRNVIFHTKINQILKF